MNLIVCMNRRKLASYEFALPIAKIAGNCDIKFFHRVSLDVAKKYDRIIISGNPLKDNRFRNEIDMFSWLDEIDVPVLGICAGMQVLLMKYGGSLIDHKEIGMKKVVTKSENPLFDGEFEAYHLHSSAPDVLGEFSCICETSLEEKYVSGIKHPNKKIFGIIFHPEVRQAEIIKRFIELK